MGCSPSRLRHSWRRTPKHVSEADELPENSFSLKNGLSNELLSEGSLLDQERMAAILQLSVSLSLLATEVGRTETQLCEVRAGG